MLFLACVLFTVMDFCYLACARVYSWTADTFTAEPTAGGAYVD